MGRSLIDPWKKVRNHERMNNNMGRVIRMKHHVGNADGTRRLIVPCSGGPRPNI